VDAKEIEKALFAKAGDWTYEDEWRAVDQEKGPGVHQFPDRALCEVILGCRILAENRRRIMQWCQKRDPRPAIFWAEVKDREFGLDIRPIPWDDSSSGVS
jgi:hypothetical protein